VSVVVVVAAALLSVAALARGLAVGAVAPSAPGAGPVPGPTPATRPALPGRWATALADAGVDGDPRRWARLGVAAVAGASVLGVVVGGPGGAVALPVVALAGSAVGLRAAAGRSTRQADATLPELLEQAGRALRSGVDLVPALAQAATAVGGPHGQQVRSAAGRVAGGAPLAVALAPWADDHPRRAVRLVVAALEVAVDGGGARARALDGVAATLRDQAALADEIRALASQARASAAVLVALPVVFGVVGSAADPRLAHTLLGTAPGVACVAGALVLDLAGAWWMHRIVSGGPGR